jgi:hypothetical protein
MNVMLRRALPSRLKYEINTLLLSCQKGKILPTDNVHLQGEAKPKHASLVALHSLCYSSYSSAPDVE